MKTFRRLVYLCPITTSDQKYAACSKYSFREIDVNDKEKTLSFRDVIGLMARLGHLPSNIHVFSEEAPDRFSFYNLRDILLLASSKELSSLTARRMLQAMAQGMPAIMTTDLDCDFVVFDQDHYWYSCFLKEHKGTLLEEYNECKCFKSKNGVLCRRPVSDDCIHYLQDFYSRFPQVRTDPTKREGRIPLFRLSFVLDYLIYQRYFGEDLFRKRFFENVKESFSTKTAAIDILTALMQRYPQSSSEGGSC